MTALGDEWARAATLANRHGHIPKDMLTPAVEHLDAATALAADWDRGTDWDRLGPKRATNRDERDERVANAATRAEASRNGAARLRSLTRTARRREASREAETMRTFDARRFARLGMAAAARRRLSPPRGADGPSPPPPGWRRCGWGWSVRRVAEKREATEGEANATGWYDEKR